MFYVRLFCVKTVFFSENDILTLSEIIKGRYEGADILSEVTDALPLRYTFITQSQILSKILQKQDLDFVYFISILKSRMVKPKKKKSCF